jgi:ribonuclease P protein component
MLPQESRLRKKDDIELVFRTGRTWHGRFFSVKYTISHADKQLPGRAAFSFSKKYLKKAVQRNRLKRRISGNLEKIKDFSLTGMDLVFYLPQQAPFPKKGGVAAELENFFKNVYNKRY